MGSAFRGKGGVFFALILVWLTFEYARPTYPLKIPLLISLTLFLAWISRSQKIWNPQIVCMLLFLAFMVLHVPFTVNEYSAFWVSYALVAPVLCICVPMAHFVDSVRRFDLLVNTLLVVFGYVAVWAIFNAGYGPGGSKAGQDENYVANMMCFMLPFAYFSVFAARGAAGRLLFLGAAGLFVLTTAVTFSRGGFLGLVAVGFYCWLRSPRKLAGALVTVVLAIVLLIVAGESYWAEINTISNTEQGSADMRIELWTIATRQFLANPLFGVGPGNFIWNIAEHETADQIAKFQRSLAGSAVTHSFYFELIAEHGSVGTLLTFLIGFFSYRDMRLVERQARTSKLRLQRAAVGLTPTSRATWIRDFDRIEKLSLAITASFIGFLVCSAFISTLYTTTFWILAALAVALRETTARRVAALAHRAAAARPEDGRQANLQPAPLEASTPSPDPPPSAGLADGLLRVRR